jgi:hypothetical protein
MTYRSTCRREGNLSARAVRSGSILLDPSSYCDKSRLACLEIVSCNYCDDVARRARRLRLEISLGREVGNECAPNGGRSNSLCG